MTTEAELRHSRAAAYGLIAHGFLYPDQDTIQTMTEPKRWEQWPQVLGSADTQIADSLRHLRCSIHDLEESSVGALQELQQNYDSIFGHSVRGRCPAFEMEYGRNEILRQASDLADLAGFYKAFGLEMTSDANGRPDHIAAECEFMSVLCTKEAHASAQGDEENAVICNDAQRTFLRDHLARWLPAFVHLIKQADANGFFGALASFADGFVKTECDRFDVRAGPATLKLKPPNPDLDTTISCGPADCGQGQQKDQVVQLGTNVSGNRNE
ncbi:MAG: molecular chaperone TorD family protein [Planctomycetes bacterium]|nr:molecular chaperone TorD family protein [Planctomycetota bacterium]